MQTSHGLGVLIGRFQPFHDAHLALLRDGLMRAARLVVIIGSAGAARRPDTQPFTAQERQAMIEACLSSEERDRVSFRAVPDFADDDLWSEAVREAVADVGREAGLRLDAPTALFGCHKDASSYYLHAFAGWTAEMAGPRDEGLSATDLRDRYFSPEPGALRQFLEDEQLPVPEPVRRFLTGFAAGPEYAALAEEWAFALDYRRRWEAAPYAPTFITADAVVLHRGAVLLIQRRSLPGRGLWALPGGFLDSGERIADAAVRELAEETGLVLTWEQRRAIAHSSRVFDNPRRDIRGRTVTHAFLFDLPADQPRPRAAAADDAAQARWIELSDLRRDEMYGDHYQIIQTFVRRMFGEEDG